jgi:probable phosphoglycerate mutase
MSVPKLVILVRHAQSEHHVQRLTGGWTDTPLTDAGHEQSRLVAARLRDELGGAPIRLYTSDLVRAAQTAEHIADAFGVKPVQDARLREHNNGAAANLTVEEAEARFPHTWNVTLTLDTRPFPGSETPREFYERAGGFIDDLQEGEGVPVVVSHGGTILCLIGRWLNLTPQAMEPIGFSAYTTAIAVLQARRDAERWLERMNDVAHLTGHERGWTSIGSLLGD